jgi:hypothetical protein
MTYNIRINMYRHVSFRVNKFMQAYHMIRVADNNMLYLSV